MGFCRFPHEWSVERRIGSPDCVRRAPVAQDCGHTDAGSALICVRRRADSELSTLSTKHLPPPMVRCRHAFASATYSQCVRLGTGLEEWCKQSL